MPATLCPRKALTESFNRVWTAKTAPEDHVRFRIAFVIRNPSSLALSDVIERHAATFAEGRARFCNSTQELRMMLEAVVEPVILGREPDQYTSGSPVTCNHDLLFLRQS